MIALIQARLHFPCLNHFPVWVPCRATDSKSLWSLVLVFRDLNADSEAFTSPTNIKLWKHHKEVKKGKESKWNSWSLHILPCFFPPPYRKLWLIVRCNKNLPLRGALAKELPLKWSSLKVRIAFSADCLWSLQSLLKSLWTGTTITWVGFFGLSAASSRILPGVALQEKSAKAFSPWGRNGVWLWLKGCRECLEVYGIVFTSHDCCYRAC